MVFLSFKICYNVVMNTEKIKTFFSRKNILLITLVLIIFFLGMRLPLDPDLGWHLRSGQYIWEHKGLAETDPFSHTFPEYPWIAHEWLADLIMYGLNSIGPDWGIVALSVFYAGIAAAGFLLAGKSFSARKEYQYLAAMLALLVSVPIVGIRPQVISMLGLGITFFILYRFRNNGQSKAIYFLPLVFALWVNLHGGFSFGLFAIGLFFLVELLRLAVKWLYLKIRKKELASRVLKKASFIKLMIVGLASGAATLINPYGFRLYEEIYGTFVNTTGSAFIKQNIAEWNPVQFGHQMSIQLMVYLSLIVLLLLFSFKKIDFTHLTISVVFFIIGISSWRHMPLLMLAITPFWVSIAQNLTGDTLARILRKKFVLLLFVIALVLIVRQQISGLVIYGLDPAKAAEKSQAPYQAIQWLKEHPPKGNVLNEYNYGGYQIWHYPEKKVFIDGRMAIWEYQGKNVYQDWIKIGKVEEGYLDLIDKYDVDWVLVRKRLAIAVYLANNENWDQIYEDDLFTVIVRKGSQDES